MDLAKQIKHPEIQTSDSVVSEVIHLPNDHLEKSITNVLEPLGGLKNYISKNDKVMLKPNFNTGDPFPASTDPNFLLAIIQLILALTPNIQIIESSTLRVNTKQVIKDIMGDKIQNIPLVTEEDFDFITIDLKSRGAKYLKSVKLPNTIHDPEAKIILLPCLKTHFIAHYTGALKLAVGFMERKQRLKMHISRRVPEKVAELNLAYKPDLIIMDARKIFVTKGPANGRVESPQKILAAIGSNRTAIDIKGISIIQSFPAENKLKNTDVLNVRTIKRALELGID
ncbi:MAG: DUF362 domain-containing protein [Candidatus Heimdallarchaeota archaeon]|nr:MAG: DUF362 domain-containing protein [Candidatus Heimdallarchaeota archaeon]